MIRVPRSTASFAGAAACALLLAAPAQAQDVLLPYAGLQYDYNTNVFALPNRHQAQLQNGDDKLDDSIMQGVIGLALDYPIGRQRLRAEVEGRYEQYLYFDELRHSEYRYGAALDWRLSDSLDGNIGYGEERRMPSFVERSGTTGLNLETERHASAAANLQLVPDWRIGLAMRGRHLDAPLPEEPEFELREQAARAALDYVGAQSLVLGAYFEYLTGEFLNIADAREFTQESWGFSASYGVPRLYGLGVEVGFTDRQDEKSGLNGVSEPTGRIGYRRAISGKTVAGVTAFRQINSNVLEGGFVDELGLEAAMTVQATGKSEAALGYQYLQSRFQNVQNPELEERKDRMHTLEARWTWEALPSLLVRANLGWQVRDSNQPLFRFHGAVLGVAFVFARRPPGDSAARLVGVRSDLIDGALPPGSIPQ